MPQHIQGIDHLVILVADLEAAAETYRRLGFTLSPKGLHSEHMGTGNYTMMLETDYLEILAVVADTKMNAAMREWLAAGEGLYATALKTDDAAAMGRECAAAGIGVAEPVSFQRPVDLPGGGTGDAAFTVTRFDHPGGARETLFGCQHLTRDTVWLPDLMSHANGATAIQAVDGVASDPDKAAADLAVLFDATPVRDGETVRIDAQDTEIRLTKGDTKGLPLRFTGMTLAVGDLAKTRAALKDVPHHEADGAITVASDQAHGVTLTFRAV